MYNLKKFKNGLITYQTFNLQNQNVEEPLYIDANYSFTDEGLIIHGQGIIYFYLQEYNKLVFEVNNNFKPIDIHDIGGISVLKGDTFSNLYEEFQADDHEQEYNILRVTKMLNNFYGEGSYDGQVWRNKGTRYIFNADLIGIGHDYQYSDYELHSIKVYKDSLWYIYGLKEYYKVFVYDLEDNLTNEYLIDSSQVARIKMPQYPVDCKLKVQNEEGIYVMDDMLSSIWGGDEYYLGLDIDLYDEHDKLLSIEDNKFMGVVKYGRPLNKLIKIKNHGITGVDVIISVMPESPAYEWITLEYGDIFDKTIQIYLDALETDIFYINIGQPDNVELLDNNIPFDYEVNTGKYLFYLEIK